MEKCFFRNVNAMYGHVYESIQKTTDNVSLRPFCLTIRCKRSVLTLIFQPQNFNNKAKKKEKKKQKFNPIHADISFYGFISHDQRLNVFHDFCCRSRVVVAYNKTCITQNHKKETFE